MPLKRPYTDASNSAEGVVTLLGARVSDGVSGHGGAESRPCAQGVAGRPETPVTWSQIPKRMVISASTPAVLRDDQEVSRRW